MEINDTALDKFREIGKAFALAFNTIFECLKRCIKWIKENWKWLKEKIIELYQFEEKKQKDKKYQYHMNFHRKKINHQVIDRRPKQMIRKIIR